VNPVSAGATRPLRVALRSQGCKVNACDLDALETALLALDRPMEVVPWDAPADVYVLNTCTVTAAADRDNRKLVYQLGRREPGAALVVTGCQATVAPEAVAALPGVLRVVPNEDKAGLPEVLAGLVPRPDLGADGPGPAARRTRPFLKVQDGCDARCAYCIVPAARGPARSVGADEVLGRLHALGEAGAPEVVLTGVDLGAWGRDLTPRSGLADLLARVEAEAPVPRLRLSSLEPRGLTERLLEVLAGAGRVCRHLHVPLQSGDDGVLAAMGRPYRAADLLALGERLAERLPGLGLGTDVICGFPGEDEAAFDRTLALCHRLPLTYLHAFPFSPRPGTPAAARPDDVPHGDKKRRVAALRSLSAARRAAFVAAHVGRTVEVAVEGEVEEGLLRGLTRRYVQVRFLGPATAPSRLLRVRVDAAEGGLAHGVLAEEEA